MKRIVNVLLMTFLVLAAQAQIHTPVKWKIKLEDSGKPEKAIVFTAVAERGWHLYDMNLPAGGPVSTSITYETMKGAELVGKVVCFRGSYLCIRRIVCYESSLVQRYGYVYTKN
jgi:hypothetical protein